MQAALVILVALLATAGIAYCLLRPRYAIVPVLMFFPAEQILMGYVPELRWKYGWVSNVVVGMVALFGVASHFLRGEKIFEGHFNRVFVLLMVLYGYMMVSLTWTPAPDSAQYFLNKSWAYFFLFYLVAPLLVRDLDELTDIPVPLIILGVSIMALMAVNPNAKFINDRFTIDLGYQVGFGQTQSNPLAIADAGGILAIISAIYKPNQARPMLTFLKWAGVLLGLSLALLSGSRGQVVAAIGIIAIMLPFAGGSKSAVRVAGTFLVVGIMVGFLYFIFNTFVISAAQTRWSGQGQTEGLNARLDMITTILASYGTQPAFWLTGLGAAAFNAFYTFRTTDNPHWYPHNIVVESATEYGVIGLVLVGFLLYWSALLCKRMIELAGDDRARRTTAVVFAGIVLFQFLMTMKQGYLLGMPPLFMFCLIVARVVHNEQKKLDDYYTQLEQSGSSDDPLTVDQPASGEPNQPHSEDNANGGWRPVPGTA